MDFSDDPPEVVLCGGPMMGFVTCPLKWSRERVVT